MHLTIFIIKHMYALSERATKCERHLLLLLFVFSLSDAWLTNEADCGLPMRLSHVADMWAHLYHQKTRNCV